MLGISEWRTGILAKYVWESLREVEICKVCMKIRAAESEENLSESGVSGETPSDSGGSVGVRRFQRLSLVGNNCKLVCSIQVLSANIPFLPTPICKFASLFQSSYCRLPVFRCFCLAANDSNFFVYAFRSSLLSALFHTLCLRPHPLSPSSYLSRPSCRPGLSSTSQLRSQICGILIMSNNQRGRHSFFSASDNPDLTLFPDSPDPQPPAGESNSHLPVQPRRPTRVPRPVVGRHLNQTYQTPIQPPSQSSCFHVSFQRADMFANQCGLSRSTRRTTTSARTTPVVPGTPISTIVSAARSSARSLNRLQTIGKHLCPTCSFFLDSLVTAYDPAAPFDADTIRVADTAQSDSEDQSSQPPQGSAPQSQPEVRCTSCLL